MTQLSADDTWDPSEVRDQVMAGELTLDETVLTDERYPMLCALVAEKLHEGEQGDGSYDYSGGLATHNLPGAPVIDLGGEVEVRLNLPGVQMVGTVKPVLPPASDERTEGFNMELGRALGRRGYDITARQEWLAKPQEALGGLTCRQVMAAPGFTPESAPARLILRLAKSVGPLA